MTKWQAIHAFNRLVKQERVEPLKCPDDDATYVTKIGKDDEPVLHCFACESTVLPGLALWKQLGAVIGVEVEAS